MEDRELLEMAAKATGIVGLWHERGQCILVTNCAGMPDKWWRPQDDDGDSLRLAVHLNLTIERSKDGRKVYVGRPEDAKWLEIVEDWDEEYRCEATRRAIVRAAAEIGKRMP